MWDGGGTDTYDFSNYPAHRRPAVMINLGPGTMDLAGLGAVADRSPRQQSGNIANALLYNDDPRSLIENVIGSAGRRHHHGQ